MKKIWLMGGFGNVLFQILAFNIISRNNKDVYFVKNLTEKNFITECLGWTIHQKLYEDLIREEDSYDVGYFNSIVIIIISFLSKKLKKYFNTSTFYCSDIQLDENVSDNVFGYFQDKTFLSKNKEEILILGEKLRNLYAYESTLTVVHFRSGDSEWAKKFSDYYFKVKQSLKKESGDILIVTDSLIDAKLFFSEINNIKIIKSSNAIDDFKHLLSAKKLYCAPSTFSWWAAHSLDENAKVVISKELDDILGVYTNAKDIQII